MEGDAIDIVNKEFKWHFDRLVVGRQRCDSAAQDLLGRRIVHRYNDNSAIVLANADLYVVIKIIASCDRQFTASACATSKRVISTFPDNSLEGSASSKVYQAIV
ncbi:hypothetical protein Q31b_52150 [Novipirellula aureliae]|uniref:Uncharacterized protein n=1 Tax=Novipirellula aureliae TaxID=2527966 RepID=A0A5C6DG60_9BACT|nr:hypothetical protein Q31b_52150 [Novipirellula aureliae]